jgi:SH3-like domain-containing protein
MRKSVYAVGLALAVSLNVLPEGALAAPRALSPTRFVSGAAIVQTALRYLGYPYTAVGNSPATGFSCIGFVSYVYQSNGIPLPDDLGAGMAYAPSVAFSDLQPGDVLWFQNTVWAGLSHTAIYLGGGRFVHAEWYNRGVVISSFSGDPVDGDYWTAHYLGATRPWAVAPAPPAPQPASRFQATAPSPAAAPLRPIQRVAPVLRSGPRAMVRVAGLNLRVRPSINAPIRRMVGWGTHVVVLKQYGYWDWVQLPSGAFGWVYQVGLRGGGTSAPASPIGRLYVRNLPSIHVAVAALRVRSRPGLAAPIVHLAYRGQRLRILRQWNGWLRVFMPDGTRGWISSAYVSGASGSSAAPSVQSSPVMQGDGSTSYSAPKLTAGVRVHVRPGLGAPVLGLAARGTHVRVLGAVGSWVHLRLPSGRTGYVYGPYVQQ